VEEAARRALWLVSTPQSTKTAPQDVTLALARLASTSRIGILGFADE
jgi:hypothetical protein